MGSSHGLQSPKQVRHSPLPPRVGISSKLHGNQVGLNLRCSAMGYRPLNLLRVNLFEYFISVSKFKRIIIRTLFKKLNNEVSFGNVIYFHF